jgi:hypothetical protein
MGKDLPGARNNNSEYTTTPVASAECEGYTNAELRRPVVYLECNLGFVEAFYHSNVSLGVSTPTEQMLTSQNYFSQL